MTGDIGMSWTWFEILHTLVQKNQLDPQQPDMHNCRRSALQSVSKPQISRKQVHNRALNHEIDAKTNLEHTKKRAWHCIERKKCWQL